MTSPLSCNHRTERHLPARVGPAEISQIGKLVVIKAPRDFDHIFRDAGGTWDPGGRRWLFGRRQAERVIKRLGEVSDPLFRSQGMALDG